MKKQVSKLPPLTNEYVSNMIASGARGELRSALISLRNLEKIGIKAVRIEVLEEILNLAYSISEEVEILRKS